MRYRVMLAMSVACLSLAACFGPGQAQIVANQNRAMATLKAGIYPAQITFISALHRDVDGDNRGEYAAQLAWLAGGTDDQGPTVALDFLPEKFNGGEPLVVDGFRFDMAVGEDAERSFSVVAVPVDAAHGDRAFALSQLGEIFFKQVEPGTDLGAGDPWTDPHFSEPAEGWAIVE